VLGGRGHRAGGQLELGRCRGDAADDFADGPLELVGKLEQHRRLLGAHFFLFALLFDLLGAKPVEFQVAATEGFE
jgi:hypothetical protein